MWPRLNRARARRASAGGNGTFMCSWRTDHQKIRAKAIDIPSNAPMNSAAAICESVPPRVTANSPSLNASNLALSTEPPCLGLGRGGDARARRRGGEGISALGQRQSREVHDVRLRRRIVGDAVPRSIQEADEGAPGRGA